jgi:hypothetical protein
MKLLNQAILFSMFVLHSNFVASSSESSEQKPSKENSIYLRMVLDSNSSIRQKNLNWGLAALAVENAESEFETTLKIDLNTDDNFRRLTSTDLSGLQGFSLNDEYASRKNILSAVVSRKIATTGATVGFSINTSGSKNDNQEDGWQSGEYESYAGINFIQPLLQGRGRDASYASVRTAEKERIINYQSWRDEASNILLSASSAYWNLYLAQKKLTISIDSLEISKELLKDQRLRFDHGKGDKVNVVDAEMGVLLRESDLVDSTRRRNNAEIELRELAGDLLEELAVRHHRVVRLLDLAAGPLLQNLVWLYVEVLANSDSQ